MTRRRVETEQAIHEQGQENKGFTRLANYFVDHQLSRISPAEWKIASVVLRDTVGWNRPEAEISLDRFVRVSGMKRQAVVNAIQLAVRRGFIVRRTEQVGRRRCFFYHVVERANLRNVERPKRVRQTRLPFVLPKGTEFEKQTPSRSMKIKLGTECENQTPSRPVLIIDLKKGGSLNTHTKKAAAPRACGSRFEKELIRQYAWANHHFVDKWNATNPGRKIAGIRNPDGWAKIAYRTGDDDEQIQEWLDNPSMFKIVSNF